jgi:sulfoxide reductase catalytic subunit YedY
MFIREKKTWHIPESEATPEGVYMGRRRFLKKAGAYGLGAGLLFTGTGGLIDLFPFGKGTGGKGRGGLKKIPKSPTSGLYPAKRNLKFTLDRPLTDELVAARYNNFYEFTTRKTVWRNIDNFVYRPWTVEITGLVEKPFTIDIDSLVKKMPIEERLYRHRCVEAWAMAVPWTGFPMRELVKLSRPLSGARYVKLQTFLNKELSLEQRVKFWLPWPYEEGLTMAEATNELTLLATGIYGHELPAQHGAPLRLVAPWKYGFKSIKSIVRVEFTDAEPKTFWNTLVSEEYDFIANVNPKIPHPRWSQAFERMIGTDERRETVLFNGYGEYVAGMYGG